MDTNLILILTFILGISLAVAISFIIAKLTNKGKGSFTDYDQIKEHAIAQNEELKITKENNSILEEKAQNLSESLIKEKERCARLEAENENLEEKLAEQKNLLEENQKQLREQFENLANKLLEQNASKFNETSSKSLETILNPLKNNLEIFQKKIDDSFGKQAKETFSLQEQIKNIVEMNDKMSAETTNLTKALRGESKTQGDWGEVILERILEASGLREGEEYITQGRDMKLRNEHNKHLKPDVIINLPDDKHIIVDSKTSLTHYYDYINAEDDTQKDAALKKFITSVHNHVKDLSGKNYEYLEKLNAPEFVFMFMPIEGAFSLAIQSDKELFNFAWSKRIVIISPSTMFANLQTVASMWRLEQQNKNTLEIARQSGDLYDKFVGFVEDMLKIEKSLKNTETSFLSAMNKLHDGRGNLITRAEKIKALGVKTKKELPKELIASENDLLYIESNEE